MRVTSWCRVKDTLPRVKVTQLPFNHTVILLSSFPSCLCRSLPLSSISHSAESAVGPCTCPLCSHSHTRGNCYCLGKSCCLTALSSSFHHTLTHSRVYRESQVCYACPTLSHAKSVPFFGGGGGVESNEKNIFFRHQTFTYGPNKCLCPLI